MQDRLTYDWEIRTPSNDLVAVIAQRDPEGELAIVLQRNNRAELDAWLYGRDVLDLLGTSPKVQLTRLEITNLFRPLLARQFSIASSPLEAPDRVDLTVATVRYGDNREYRGVATTYLADRIAIGETVKVFPQPNAAFGLPRDPAAALIMIGAGTGIAPFRGFLRDRQLSGATGRNWLFFGARHRAATFSTSRNSRSGLTLGFSPTSTRHFHATRHTKNTFRRACSSTQKSCTRGSRKGPTSMSAAMRSEWRRMSSPPS
ncbi:hypothetical protein IU483_34705 [Streptomyces gardneri]|nr:hypothetical protein [Streptomyces gardneri]